MAGKDETSNVETSSGPDKRPVRRPFIRASYVWAVLFTLAIAGWLGSGDLVIGGQGGEAAKGGAGGGTGGTAESVKKSKDKKRVSVRVATSRAVRRKAVLTLRGRTEAYARVHVRAETSGMVKHLPYPKGAFVKKGALLCELDQGVRRAELLQRKAGLAQAEADFAASARLVKRGHVAKLKMIAERAKLDAARAAYARASLDLERTKVAAPFDGIIEEQPAKVGDYLTRSGHCATLVDLDPLLVVASVSERDIAKVRKDGDARVKLITGETVTGRISYIARSGDAKTRTFRLEVEIPNPKRSLRDGLTADVMIPLDSTPAHHVSPAILALDDAGTIGVRILDVGDKVKFMPVQLAGEDAKGVWIAGLPATVRIITVGQEYVVEGETVNPVDVTDAGAETPLARAR